MKILSNTVSCSVNHTESISPHITPIVINSLGSQKTFIQTSQTNIILRNQLHAGKKYAS